MDITKILTIINNLLNDVPTEAWQVLIELTIAAVLGSNLTLGIKKWWHVDNERKMFSLTIVSMLVAALIVHLRNVPELHPFFAAIGLAVAFIINQNYYRFFLKPLVARLSAWMTENIKELNADEAKTAIEPTVTPVRGTQIDDFIVR